MCVNLYKVYVSGMVRLLPEIAHIDLFTKKPPPRCRGWAQTDM